MHPTIVVAYNATEEAADGLALGRLLAGLDGAHLAVAPVLTDSDSTEVTDRSLQREFRRRLGASHDSAADVLGDEDFELWPMFGMPVAEGIHALAADRDARVIVFGSTHHGPVGRVLLHGAAEDAIHGSPCAVAVAPHGFREHPVIDPLVVGVAFDGSDESVAALRAGHELARASKSSLRVIAVKPTGWSRHMPGHDPTTDDLFRRCRELGHEVDIEPAFLRGNPAGVLARESKRLGLLVCGSRGLGGLPRVFLGSVSAAVMRQAACPVVVVPPSPHEAHEEESR